MHVIFPTFVPELWPLFYAKISFLFNILRTNGQNFTKFYICIHIDKIYIEIVTHHFLHICTRVMDHGQRRKFLSPHYLESKSVEFTKFYIAFILTRSMLELLHIIFRTFLPELCQNFVSIQYLENIWMEFHQTLYNY